MVEDKGRYALERCVGHMCGDEPYARFEYGDLEEIDELTPEAVTDAWREVLRTAPMEIYVVGSSAPPLVRDNARELFGSMRNGGARPGVPDAVRRPAGRVRRIRESGELMQARLVMGYRTDVDFGHRLAVPMSVMNTLWGASPSSRLFQNVREKHSLAYYCTSSVDLAKGIGFVQAGIDGRKAGRVEKLVTSELRAVREGRVTVEELRTAKAHITAGLLSLGDSPSRIAGFLQERQAAGAGGSVAEALSEVSRVTRKDVARAARSLELDTVYLLANGDG
jgi:predicted Zn-dependent peptidase